MIYTGCSCTPVRHAVTPDHRAALERALTKARLNGQTDLVQHYDFRLQPCRTAGHVDLHKHQAVAA